jgi:hypothetical protein
VYPEAIIMQGMGEKAGETEKEVKQKQIDLQTMLCLLPGDLP